MNLEQLSTLISLLGDATSASVWLIAGWFATKIALAAIMGGTVLLAILLIRNAIISAINEEAIVERIYAIRPRPGDTMPYRRDIKQDRLRVLENLEYFATLAAKDQQEWRDTVSVRQQNGERPEHE